MAVIDYYYYLIFYSYKKVFGTGWMETKYRTLEQVTLYILIAHIGLFVLCIKEAGVPMGSWLPITFILLVIGLLVYTRKKFKREIFQQTLSQISLQPQKVKRIKLVIVACLMPFHILVFLNMHLIRSLILNYYTFY